MDEFLYARLDGPFTGSARQAVEEFCERAGCTLDVIANERFGRSYLRIGRSGALRSETLGELLPRARFYDGSLIALAIEPLVDAAMPFMLHALGGEGKPAGVLSAEETSGALVVELRDDLTSPALVLTIADVELKRFGNPGRRVFLLSPLDVAARARIAAAGMQVSELDRSRILEELLGVESSP